MTMKRFFTYLALSLGVGSSAIAQTSIQHKCGVSIDDGALIKQRLFENRANINIEQHRNRTSTTWIPITFILIGTDNGDGYMDTDDIFRTVCSLNDFYYDQDVQFYIQFPFKHFDSQTHYDDIDAGSTNALVQQKEPNCVNIFCGPSTNNPAASFYNPNGDYLFLLEAMAQGDATTLAHEVGHFFTLNHTFYGWEGEDARDYEGGPSPTSNGWWGTVEKEPRTGGSANCNSAADGFCDTPADYIAFRAGCPMNWDLRDPNNIPIDPDETNIMSYYFDECVTIFSQEQKDAIYADIVARGWTNFPAPAYTHNLVDDTAYANYPTGGITVGAPQNNELTLNWEPVTGAGGYWLRLARTHPVAPINYEILIDELIMDPTITSYVVDTTMLNNPDYYRWRVIPFNSYKPCADYGLGNYNNFYFSGTSDAQAGDSNANGVFDEGEIAGDVDGNGVIDGGEVTGDLNGNGIIDNGEVLGDKDGDGVADANSIDELVESKFTVYPNPANNFLVVELGNVESKTISVLDFTGKVIVSEIAISDKHNLNIENLSGGIYFVRVGNTQVKFVKM